uniref:KIB1-4 beta-propeller domain-containing protein n=1 Tax=Oryza nivara TaxID=4536 RepID=A0A0E0I2C2_ORYNI
MVDRKEEAVELGDAAHRPHVEVREADEHPRRVRPPLEALLQHAVRDGVCVPRAAYVERSFLVESPPGSPSGTGDRHGLMQVELLRPVAAAEEEGFKVCVLDECGETWEEADDIGDVAVVVDASGVGAASTRECPRLRLSTMYFAVDPAGKTLTR